MLCPKQLSFCAWQTIWDRAKKEKGHGWMRSMRKGNKKPYIYLSSPHMSEEAYEQAYVKEAFDTNWIAPLGKM